mgnify:FL=1
MSKLIIEIETLKAGQPRAYADSVYEYLITVKNYWESTTGLREGSFSQKEQDIKYLVKTFSRHFEDEPKCWADARLSAFEKIDFRTFRITIIEPYTD